MPKPTLSNISAPVGDTPDTSDDADSKQQQHSPVPTTTTLSTTASLTPYTGTKSPDDKMVTCDYDKLATMHLFYAAKLGDVARLAELVACRANVNSSDYDTRTALHVAAAAGQYGAVKFLVRHNADPNAIDHFGQTPLSESQRRRDPRVENLLNKHGACPQSAALKIIAARESWALQRVDVDLGEKLNETIKSEVFKATWRGTEVVAKLAKPVGVDSIAIEKEMLHEMQVLSNIRHPDLVLFLGACLDDPVMFILEYMPGGDLEHFYKRKRQEAQSIWRPKAMQLQSWSLDVSRALCFLHNCQPPLVHRDLKPLNLLLADRGKRLKVCDFGISKFRSPQPSRSRQSSEDETLCPLSPTSQISHKMTGGVGTLRYMAPEVVRCQKYSEKIDIYSFALTLFFMSSGRNPFYEMGTDSELVLKAYLEGDEPRPNLADCPAPLRPILSEAWHAKPEQRPSAYELTEMLAVLNQSSSCTSFLRGFAGAVYRGS